MIINSDPTKTKTNKKKPLENIVLDLAKDNSS